MEPHHPGRPSEPDESLGAVFSRLGRLFAALVRNEVDLVKAEASEKAIQLALGAGAVIGGAMVALAGVIVLFEGIVASLRDHVGVHPAFSALAATVLIAVVAGSLVYGAIRRLKPSGLVPRRTIDSLQRDRDLIESLGR